MKIYKYALELKDQQILIVPEGAEILTAKVQHNRLCLWVLIDPNEEQPDPRLIEIFGTGHNIPDGERKYLGTFMLNDGNFVGHAFELKYKGNADQL